MFSFFLSLQLDPQTVETKNWHTDVIEMNGVSPETQEMSAQWVGLWLLSPGCCLTPVPSARPIPPYTAGTLPTPTLQVFRGALGGGRGPTGRGPLHSGGTHAPGDLCLPYPQPDQSGILHEVHQPRYEPKEDPVQKADWSLRREDQRGD